MIACLAAAERSDVEPYFFFTCSVVFSPSGGMSGLSSNGWKWISATTSGPIASSACLNDRSPITHQGQATSETKSMRSGGAMKVSLSPVFPM